MYINSSYNFHNFYIIPVSNLNQIQDQHNKLNTIPIPWRLFLMSDGSCTKNLESLTGDKIHVHLSQKSHYTYTINIMTLNTRTVWLETQNNQLLVFAKSICILKKDTTKYMEVYNNKPIGKSLIKSKIDIYKNIEEIYYGHCDYLEKKFHSNQKIWGRKYTTYYKQNSYITIQEFFSPQLISFFYA